MKKYLVVGNPIDHSLSPKLQNYWLNFNKIEAIYGKLQAYDDDLKESEMTPEQRKAAGARCKQLGYLTASEAQKRLLMAINNFNRASAGKLLEPNK